MPWATALVVVALLSAAPAAADGSITVEEVERLLPAATAALSAAGHDVEVLDTVVLEVVELDDLRVGEAMGPIVRLDPTAAGVGWVVDPPPWSAEEFGPNRLGVARASAAPAAGLVDVWSTLGHELGHVVGLDHDDGGFMTATLVWGERWSPVLWGSGPTIV